MKHLSFLRIALLLAAVPTLSAQTYTLLYSFGINPDPAYPANPGMIAQGRDGAMYSTAGDGNSGRNGEIFRMTTAGSITDLHTFSFSRQATSGLTLGTDGRYYGTTVDGGTYGKGMIYKMRPDGAVTMLYSFHGGADGASPADPPIESEAGEFFGTANSGGTGNGVVYKVSRYGEYTVLHTFNGTDGSGPVGPLVQGTDYYFYGATTGGGAHGDGTIYRIDRDGNFKLLFSFDGTNGQYPTVGLTMGSDGKLYGVTAFGGRNDLGVAFKMTLHGTITLLHQFSGYGDGYGPWAPLVLATDGNLYGTSNGGAQKDGGALFRITPSGDFNVLHTFEGSTSGSGWRPLSALVQHTDGLLYGMTKAGGFWNSGAFYSLNVGLKPFVKYLPTYGRAGALVRLLGQGFTANSVVSFNGVPANFTAVSPTYIEAFVPGGATTGPITVKTSAGTLTSSQIFIVHPH